MHEEALIHGTCIAIGAEGVLLVGKPGSGKSDLALRLIDQSGSGLSGIQKTVMKGTPASTSRRASSRLIPFVVSP